MSVRGMDTEQVSRLGAQLAQIAARVRELEAGLGQRIEQAPWRGDDRDRFVQHWQGAQAARLRLAAEALESASAVAAANVAEQERVSS